MKFKAHFSKWLLTAFCITLLMGQTGFSVMAQDSDQDRARQQSLRFILD
jgi:hypothetical protein